MVHGVPGIRLWYQWLPLDQIVRRQWEATTLRKYLILLPHRVVKSSTHDAIAQIYEPLPQYGGGRIHPYYEEDLCWERTRVNAYQLRPCSPLDDINTTQIVLGFHETGRFEMHPYGWDENATTHVNGPKCLNSHHHPKEDELVRAEFCKFSRKARVSRWIVHNPVLVTGGSSGGSGGGGGNGDPPVTAISGEYCQPDAQCDQCFGDCDTDDDCKGNLVCFQRDGKWKEHGIYARIIIAQREHSPLSILYLL